MDAHRSAQRSERKLEYDVHSSSGCSSARLSRIAFWPTGRFLAGAFAAGVSAETLNRSSTSEPIVERSEFCCVTTDEAMLSLNRCRLEEEGSRQSTEEKKSRRRRTP